MTFQYMPLNLTLNDLEHQGQSYQNLHTNISKNNGLILTKFDGQFIYHPR